MWDQVENVFLDRLSVRGVLVVRLWRRASRRLVIAVRRGRGGVGVARVSPLEAAPLAYPGKLVPHAGKLRDGGGTATTRLAVGLVHKVRVPLVGAGGRIAVGVDVLP